MRITFEANHLAATLNAVKSAGERKSAIPALSMALIEASNGRMTVEVTNTEQFASSSLECNGEAAAVCVPIWFLETVAAQAGARVALDFTSTSVKAFNGALRLSADTLPAHDFPKWEPTFSGAVAVPAADLMKGLLFCLPATDHPSLFYLQGVHWGVDDGGVALTGTNSTVILSARLDGINAPESSMIIPAETIRMLVALVGKDKGESVAVEIGSSAVAFSYGAHRLVSKLIDGEFPDVTRFLPQMHERQAMFSGGEALAVVKRVRKAISSARGEQRTPVRVNPSASGLLIGRGDVVVDLIPGQIEGGIVEFGVEAKLLALALEAMLGAGAETLTLSMGGPSVPALITADETSAIASVFPLHAVGIPALDGEAAEHREAA